MAITHLVNRQNLYLTILATILIIILLGPARAGAAIAPDDPIPIAQVLGVIVNNRVVEEARAPGVVIIRAPGGCAATEVVRKGLPLCKGDRITTQAQVMLKIAFGDPKERNEVTIGSPSAESEIIISSTSCGRVCQWFSSLRNSFTNRTRRVAFTNKSTVYEVVGEEDESVFLYVYEGEVEARKIEARPAAGPSPTATTEPAASPAPSPNPAATAEPAASPSPDPSPTATTEPTAIPAPSPSPAATAEPAASPSPDPSPTATTEPAASPAPSPSPAATTEPAPSSTPATETAPLLVVGRLFKVKFDAAGNPTRPERMKDTDVCTQLRPSSDAEIALHKQPAEIAGNVSKFPNYLDNATRNDKFRTLRCDSFLNPSEPSNFEELGYIYNDWGNAEQALVFLATAAEKWRQKIAQANLREWTPRDKIRINRAIALRQLSQYDDALAELTPMITEPDWLDDAYNVRGSISYDQARKVLIADRTEAGTTRAKELLEKANSDYETAKENPSGQQHYVMVNQAQVFKTRGDIAQRLGDLATNTTQRDANYNEAVQHYIHAIELLKDSYGRTNRNNSQNKIAGLLVARARAALANTYAAMGKTEDSVSYYARAEETYHEAIREDDTFAAAYCGLASLNLILGKPEVTENYRKCITFNTSALVSEVEVPHVVGLRRAAAIQTLAEVGLEPEIVADGETVASQDPAPGGQSQPQKTKIGTKVKLSLAVPSRE